MSLTHLGLFLASLIAGTISATLGMAGGIFLMSVLLLFFPLAQALPLHGLAQFTSNLGRVLSRWNQIHWRTALAFSWPVLPGALLGYTLLQGVPPDWAEFVLGLLVIGFTLKPKWFIPGRGKPTPRLFAFIGFSSSFLGMLVGATGPLIAPFFLELEISKGALLATKAICQAVVQGTKVPIFWVNGRFPLEERLLEIGVLLSGVLTGTQVGNWFVDRLSDRTYHRLVRVALVVLGARISLLAAARILGRA